MKSRGIGSGYGKCLICGDKGLSNKSMKDFSSRVKSKYEGGRILIMFDLCGRYAALNATEPNWVQVKVCACEHHESELIQLEKLIAENNAISINKIIEACGKKETPNNDFIRYTSINNYADNNFQIDYQGSKEQCIEDFGKTCKKNNYTWAKLFITKDGEQVAQYYEDIGLFTD